MGLTTNIELKLQECLNRADPEIDGGALLSDYTKLRSKVFETVSFIASAEPSLTDHSEKHVSDVLKRAGQLLDVANDTCTLNVMELYLLCSSILLHDVGNIHGREDHQINIGKMYNYARTGDHGSSHHEYTEEKRLLERIVAAHAGQSRSGTTDTLRDLDGNEYFKDKPVRLMDIAAIVKLADELAQGKIRTSSFVIKNLKLGAESVIHHIYEDSTKINIDRMGCRIAVTYDIHVFKKSKKLFVHDEIELKAFLKFVYHRIYKLNQERKYNKYYCEMLSPFKELSIKFYFHYNNSQLSTELDPVRITDLVVLGTPEKQFYESDPAYDIGKVVKLVMSKTK